jgi:hypothetical protein
LASIRRRGVASLIGGSLGDTQKRVRQIAALRWAGLSALRAGCHIRRHD